MDWSSDEGLFPSEVLPVTSLKSEDTVALSKGIKIPSQNTKERGQVNYNIKEEYESKIRNLS